MWENGRARPRLDKMDELAELFGVPVSDLLGEQRKRVVGTSALVPMRTLGAVHMGTMEDEPNPDEVVEVPQFVLDSLGDPDAYVVRARGACMNRRFPDGCHVLVSPNSEPRDGEAVVVDYCGEQICRVVRRGARALMLSPDSFSEEFADIIFDAPDFQEVRFQGVVKWFQADEVL